jgi:hypothetical protein
MSDIQPPLSNPSAEQIDWDAFHRMAASITDMQNAWDTFRQLTTEDGVSLEVAWSKWAETQKQGLLSPGAQAVFSELCQAGCVPEILASILTLIRFAPRLNEWWQETLGRSDERQKALLLLEKAAKALKACYGELPAPSTANTKTNPAKIEHPSLSLLTQIQSHNDMWVFFNRIAQTFDVNSLMEFAKYLLVAYVKGTTGRFRDRSVSALLGETHGPVSYDEVTHRMWRNRNYERLEHGLLMFSDLLLELSLVISRRT